MRLSDQAQHPRRRPGGREDCKKTPTRNLGALVHQSRRSQSKSWIVPSRSYAGSMFLIAASILAAGAAFTCTPTRVWDGDGPIWCAEGPKIRLAGIAAREIDGTCRRGHPCPNVSGAQARDALVSLVGEARGRSSEGHVLVSARPLRCVSQGSAKGERTAARCRTAAGIDLSCAMIRSGHALRWAQYDRRRELCR